MAQARFERAPTLYSWSSPIECGCTPVLLDLDFSGTQPVQVHVNSKNCEGTKINRSSHGTMAQARFKRAPTLFSCSELSYWMWVRPAFLDLAFSGTQPVQVHFDLRNSAWRHRDKKRRTRPYMAQARIERAPTVFSLGRSTILNVGAHPCFWTLLSVERNLIDCLKEYIAGRCKKSSDFYEWPRLESNELPLYLSSDLLY
jgi:hypothetical protein